MAIRLPFCLKLTRRALGRQDAFFASILRAAGSRTADAAFAVGSFAFKNDEQDFARALLGRRTHLWLFENLDRINRGSCLTARRPAGADAGRTGLV